MHPYVHCSIIHDNQDMETTKVSFDRGLDKEGVVHIYLEYYTAIRKDEILPFVTIWMDPENIILSKINQNKLRTI